MDGLARPSLSLNETDTILYMNNKYRTTHAVFTILS